MTGEDAIPRTGAEPRRRPIRICLAGSGGGHVRQLLDLQPLWSQHDYFFVTEDTALGQTLTQAHRAYLVPHFAWGQARLGAPFRMIAAAARSFMISAATMLKERPAIIISTGAGAVFFAVVWAKILGARVVIIESFARFEGPSLFGRLAGPLADDLIVQSPKLKAAHPRAHVFDPLRILPIAPPAKEDLIFATVGATLPFDRLVESVAELIRDGTIPQRIIVQIGIGGVAPDGMAVVETLPFDEVQTLLNDASIVICHGGTGSLITALRAGCHVIAMPRRADLGEHYDDHQSEITEAFSKRDLIQVANSVNELREALSRIQDRSRRVATTDQSEMISHLENMVQLVAAKA